MCTSELLLCCKLTSYLCRSCSIRSHSVHWHTTRCGWWMCLRSCVRMYVFLTMYVFVCFRVWVRAYVDGSSSSSLMATKQLIIIIYLSSGGLLSLYSFFLFLSLFSIFAQLIQLNIRANRKFYTSFQWF